MNGIEHAEGKTVDAARKELDTGVGEAELLMCLEQENARLKKLLAEKMREAATLRELLAEKEKKPSSDARK